MSTNPYEPPGTGVPVSTHNGYRQASLRSVRIALLIMLVPAIYNLICFNFSFNGNRIDFLVHNIYRTVNTIGFVLVVVAIWFFGLTALEFATGGVHSIIARMSKLSDWKESLYIILRRTPYFAVPGAGLWMVWVMVYYEFQLDFYIASVPIGIAAHILAAFLYVPLIYRWYNLERSAKQQITT